MSINPLNWKVEKRPLFDERGKELPIFGTFRSDNNHFLGAVTGRYSIIQNDELFKLGEALSAECKDVQLVSSGEMLGGQRVYVKYKIPSLQIDVRKKGDIVSAELMISTKHDGTGSLLPVLQTKRLICTNGATVPAGAISQSIRHNISAEEKIDEVKRLLSNVHNEFKTFGKVSDQLAQIELSQPEIGAIVQKVYYKDELNNIMTNSQKQNQARMILSLFDNNDDNKIPEIKNTAWALFNAFTRFVDHNMNFRIGANETEEQSRIRGVLFGTGEALKMKAFFEIVNFLHDTHSIDIPDSYLIGAKSE